MSIVLDSLYDKCSNMSPLFPCIALTQHVLEVMQQLTKCILYSMHSASIGIAHVSSPFPIYYLRKETQEPCSTYPCMNSKTDQDYCVSVLQVYREEYM